MKKSNGKHPSLSDFEVDVTRETEGEWYPIEIDGRGFEVKLRSPFCDDYRRIQGHLQQRSKVYVPGGDVDLVGIERCQCEAIGTSLLIDWRGLSEPFTRDLAQAVMTEHRFRKMRAAVQGLVGRLANNEEVARAEEGKSSEQPSVTASS